MTSHHVFTSREGQYSGYRPTEQVPSSPAAVHPSHTPPSPPIIGMIAATAAAPVSAFELAAGEFSDSNTTATAAAAAPPLVALVPPPLEVIAVLQPQSASAVSASAQCGEAAGVHSALPAAAAGGVASARSVVPKFSDLAPVPAVFPAFPLQQRLAQAGACGCYGACGEICSTKFSRALLLFIIFLALVIPPLSIAKYSADASKADAEATGAPEQSCDPAFTVIPITLVVLTTATCIPLVMYTDEARLARRRVLIPVLLLVGVCFLLCLALCAYLWNGFTETSIRDTTSCSTISPALWRMCIVYVVLFLAYHGTIVVLVGCTACVFVFVRVSVCCGGADEPPIEGKPAGVPPQDDASAPVEGKPNHSARRAPMPLEGIVPVA